MAFYAVESKHNDTECLQALDEFAEEGPELLKHCYFGCNVGDHRSWGILEKGSAEEVRKMVPTALRDMTNIIEVQKLTPEQIRGFHKAA